MLESQGVTLGWYVLPLQGSGGVSAARERDAHATGEGGASAAAVGVSGSRFRQPFKSKSV